MILFVFKSTQLLLKVGLLILFTNLLGSFMQKSLKPVPIAYRLFSKTSLSLMTILSCDFWPFVKSDRTFHEVLTTLSEFEISKFCFAPNWCKTTTFNYSFSLDQMVTPPLSLDIHGTAIFRFIPAWRSSRVGRDTKLNRKCLKMDSFLWDYSKT